MTQRRIVLAVLAAAWCMAGVAHPAGAQDSPALPPGLAEDKTEADGNGPSLPEGLGGDEPAGPDLPSGLEETDSSDAPADQDQPPEKPLVPDWLDFSGFWEARTGVRTQDDPYQDDISMAETRLQVDLQTVWQEATWKLVADFVYDPVLDGHAVDLERGEGWLDLRQANVLFSPTEFMDVKIGRQILTWGTGDLLFLNDNFPKDWQFYFIGRKVEYLKAPSDAAKFSIFTDVVNVDFVYTPQFDADRSVTGQRLSYWNSLLLRRAGEDAVIDADRPNRWFRDDEFALRVHKTIEGIELAGYGYWGYWKRPLGVRLSNMRPYFPNLNVYGVSVRGSLYGGVANFEGAYYDSPEDRGGEDPFVPNSEIRLLAGYTRDLPELMQDFSVGVQYYVEWMMNHDEYRRTLPPNTPAADRVRHLLTFRLTKLLMNQNLELSLFAYFSPSDQDAYLRPYVSYKIDDHWTVDFGGNVMFGKYDHTFFGQLERNSNVYFGIRYAW
ncbi:MAG: hypothetical protein ACLFV7_07790 [Phycisphaerae bacterium]